MIASDEIERIKISKTYYEILDVSRDSNTESIKHKYKKLALLLHPDKCNVDGCEDAFKKVSSAYACLSSDDRMKYDQNEKYEEEAYNDGEEFNDDMGHMFSSRDVFERFMRKFYDEDGFFEDDFYEDFDYWREQFQMPNLPHRRAKADWASANIASNEKANCFHCKKRLPAMDVRFSALPFYYEEKLCNNCFKQFELLKSDVVGKFQGFDVKDSSQKTLVFSFRGGNSKTKDRLKMVLRRDKGWAFEEHPGGVLWAVNTVEGCQCPVDEDFNALPPAVVPVAAAATSTSGGSGSKKKKR